MGDRQFLDLLWRGKRVMLLGYQLTKPWRCTPGSGNVSPDLLQPIYRCYSVYVARYVALLAHTC